MGENRVIETADLPGDSWQYSLRPHYFREYIGQTKAKENLEIFIKAAKLRKEALDHVLLYGPPGLGKTTMAGIVANELGVNLRITSGPAIERPGDLAALLTNLQERDLLFIDEIHRLSHSVEEVALCGHGRLCPRYRHRQGAQCPVGAHRLAALYPGRRYDAGRPLGTASSRPLWRHLPLGIL